MRSWTRGWDVSLTGCSCAAIDVVVAGSACVVLKALSLAGFGRKRVQLVNGWRGGMAPISCALSDEPLSACKPVNVIQEHLIRGRNLQSAKARPGCTWMRVSDCGPESRQVGHWTRIDHATRGPRRHKWKLAMTGLPSSSGAALRASMGIGRHTSSWFTSRALRITRGDLEAAGRVMAR